MVGNKFKINEEKQQQTPDNNKVLTKVMHQSERKNLRCVVYAQQSPTSTTKR